jgi:hypothetical protein
MNEVLICADDILKSACEVDVNNDRYRFIYRSRVIYFRSDNTPEPWMYLESLKDTIKEILRTNKDHQLVSMEEYIENYFELLL